LKWKGLFESLSVPKQFWYLFLFILVSYTLCTLLGLVGHFILGNPSLQDLQNPASVASLKWIQGCSSIGVFVLPALLYFYLMNIPFAKKKFSRQQLMLSIAIMLLALPVINFLVVWNESIHLPAFLNGVEIWMQNMEAQAMQMTEMFLRMNSPTDLVVNLFLIALIPALGEEFLFRGVIQSSLYRWKGNIHLSIWLSAFLFSALHMQFLGFVPRFLIGGMFGYLFFWSGSIWIPVIVHFCNNALAVTLTYLISKKQISADIETIGSHDQGTMVMFCVLGIVMLMYLFKSISETKA
jgi:uncharacterized protein